MPFVAPVAKTARTVGLTAEIAGMVDDALHVSIQPPGGPTFLDFPMDQVFMEAEGPDGTPSSLPDPALLPAADGDAIERAVGCSSGAPSAPSSWPAAASTGDTASTPSSVSATSSGCPSFLNGLARGCVPARSPTVTSPARAGPR